MRPIDERCMFFAVCSPTSTREARHASAASTSVGVFVGSPLSKVMSGTRCAASSPPTHALQMVASRRVLKLPTYWIFDSRPPSRNLTL